MTERAQQGSRTSCPGCGLVLPEVDTGTHRYIGASPACWALYGEVLAKEYTDYRYFRVHEHTVDAYAAQHAGTDGARQRQSVGVHLIGLCLLVEQEHRDLRRLPVIRQRMVERARRWPWLTPPSPDNWHMTVLDVSRATDPDEHARLVLEWARDVWATWHEHHATIREWAAEAMTV